MKTYLVGGAVRDALLGLEVRDQDWVVVGETQSAMLARGYKQVGKDFPVFLHPKTQEEYALARTERKTAKGYHGFEMDTSVNVTLEEDLLRRDLTINAIALSKQGEVVDPYGGQNDIQERTLRHISNAFCEDPVRILRTAQFAARFAHLGFKVAPETITLMSEMVKNGEVDALVPERVWLETYKALKSTSPRVFFETLRDCGALKVLFPEVDRLFGVPQKAQYHPEVDTGIHTMMVIDQACKLSQNPEVRFAALCHDLGKGLTEKSLLPSHHGHELISLDLTRILCDRIKVPNEFRDLALIVARYHTHCHRVQELRPSTLLKTLMRLDAIRKPERFENFLLSCEADARGRLGLEDNPYPQADLFRGAYAALTSVDAAQIATQGGNGKEIGERLTLARQQAIRNWKHQLKT